MEKIHLSGFDPFEGIAGWTEQNVADVKSKLNIKSEVENLVAQAAAMAAEKKQPR